MKFIGCDIFKHLHHGENAKYKRKSTDGIMPLWSFFHHVNWYQCDQRVCYLGTILVYFWWGQNSFLSSNELPNGTAEVIKEQLVSFLENSSISLSAHHLALAVFQAGDDVRYISNTFKTTALFLWE